MKISPDEAETILEAMNVCYYEKMLDPLSATLCDRIINQYPQFERHYNRLRKANDDD